MNNSSSPEADRIQVNVDVDVEGSETEVHEADLSDRPLSERLKEVVINYLPLSWVTFGGPQAHIALLFDLFVSRRKWLSEKTFADIFAISNAIPGPAGTKLAFTLALYVQNGLSSVAVALVALAAYKMGCKILVDNTDRALAIITAAIVINFTSVVWVIPTAMVVGGAITTLEDRLLCLREWWASRRTGGLDEASALSHAASSTNSLPEETAVSTYRTFTSNSSTAEPTSTLRQRRPHLEPSEDADPAEVTQNSPPVKPYSTSKAPEFGELNITYSLQSGLIMVGIAFFLLILSVIMKSYNNVPRPISILGTFYFVGMIIFGGGTVVVPLLYSYVVANGWLSDSEFLIGLAIINTMPGPNFNFAAYCGALALRGSFGTSLVGGILAWIGIYASGILLIAGILPIWTRFRQVSNVKVAFKGFSSVAVGLVFAATYILIEKAISEGPKGSSLTAYPFYVAVTGISFVVVDFMRVPAPLVVILGGVVGFSEWWIAVRSRGCLLRRSQVLQVRVLGDNRIAELSVSKNKGFADFTIRSFGFLINQLNELPAMSDAPVAQPPPQDAIMAVEEGLSNTAASDEAHLLHRPLSERLKEVVINYLPLSWITFGGPQAHIALLFDLFVTRKRWLSEKMFAEIFAISNAMPGPASTQLAFTLALVRGGVFCGILAFLIWSVPGGLVMTFFGYGVGRLGAAGIPVWVKRMQNGLASVAVALVALAAYKLGCKILIDNTSRCLGIIAAAIVINYPERIWVIPVLMLTGGVVTTVEDKIPAITEWFSAKKSSSNNKSQAGPEPVATSTTSGTGSLRRRANASSADSDTANDSTGTLPTPSTEVEEKRVEEPKEEQDPHLYFTYSLRSGLIVVGIAILFLIVAVILRSVDSMPRPVSILGTFYFVGIIIFGGGPVVVPLLYSYVVTNGWLSDSEFLIGLAIINAMPGPNFNFAAFCGALAMRENAGTSLVGGTLAWVGIFAPGLLLKAGILPIWKQYRGLPKVKVAFKGFNSVAVGLVFAATYILFQKAIAEGVLGSSLGMYPFYMAVTGISYVLVEFIKIPAPFVVILGGIVGVIEWVITKDR
ncbi:hypothetical protein HDU67_005516 [Dinochytrium kinnereticum]|nr:hypothetical protein HDU67_005516 [Dinochytrium kinnereticum]